MGLRRMAAGFRFRHGPCQRRMQNAHLAIAGNIDSAGDTNPSELIYKVSPVWFDVAGPVVGIRGGGAGAITCIQ